MIWKQTPHRLHVMFQVKAQAQQTREFQTKSIKEKAVHLTALFPSESSVVSKVIRVSGSLHVWTCDASSPAHANVVYHICTFMHETRLLIDSLLRVSLQHYNITRFYRQNLNLKQKSHSDRLFMNFSGLIVSICSGKSSLLCTSYIHECNPARVFNITAA